MGAGDVIELEGQLVIIDFKLFLANKWGQTTFRKHSENVVCPLFTFLPL